MTWNRRVLAVVVVALALYARPALAGGGTADCTFNFTNTGRVSVLLTSDQPDVLIQVGYLGSKAGQAAVAEFDDIPPIRLHPGKTTRFDVDLTHPAFAGGYGAVHLSSVNSTGMPSTALFMAWVRHDGTADVHGVSGLDLRGKRFKIPVTPTRGGRLRIVVTNINSSSDYYAAVEIRTAWQDGTSSTDFDQTFQVINLATLRWDSADAGYVLTGEPIEVLIEGTAVVSIYEELTTSTYETRRTHSYMARW